MVKINSAETETAPSQPSFESPEPVEQTPVVIEETANPIVPEAGASTVDTEDDDDTPPEEDEDSADGGSADGSTAVDAAIVGQINATGEAHKLSPKNKTLRGVPAGYKTTWVPLDLPADTNAILNKAAKHNLVDGKPQKVGDMLGPILKGALEPLMAGFKADAEAYDLANDGKGTKAKSLDEMSDEEANAFVAKQQAAAQKALAAANELVAKLQARAAAAVPAG